MATAHLELPSIHRYPLLHANEPVACATAGTVAGTVVDHLELECRIRVPNGDPRLRPSGVLEDVGERLLNDPVGGQVKTSGQSAWATLDDDLHRQARTAYTLGECV